MSAVTLVFNIAFLSAVAVAVANAAQQAGQAASRRRNRLDPVNLERRSSPARHRRRQTHYAATLAPDTVHGILEHVSGPAVTDSAAAAAAAAPAAIAPAAPVTSAAFSPDDDYAGYERYPSRYDESTNSSEKRFKPSSVADILDYLYETDRSLYDELQLKVARRPPPPPPPPTGTKEGEYAAYLASVYGYSGLGKGGDGYSGLGRGGDGYSGLGRAGDEYRRSEGEKGDWYVDQESAQLRYRVAGGAGLSGKALYEEEDPLGAPLKYHQR